MTPRDHFITALVTVGEGYHNFHHQFPMDYRNATKWYQYDPTKWFIAVCSFLGLASHLHVFPDNEVRKGRLAMQLQKLHEDNQDITWPTSANHLPVISWADYQAEAKSRPLIVVSGFIHDVGSFMDQHPGGRHLLQGKIGKDATTAFMGGIYDHSNAAHNLLSMMRVGVLDGGYQLAKDQLDAAKEARTPELSEADSSGSEDETPGTPKNEENTITLDGKSAAVPSADNKALHPKAQTYVVPGECYSIVKRGELKANSTALKNGGRVGALMWSRQSKATPAA
ncbi:stearoyl-CoA 9-desaturase [Tilletia horrida]|nr:stearoyl-CoA 9-desaturase [Tilletia horrida]